MSSDDYPLMTLHPVADGHHRWSGMLVQCEADGGGMNGAELSRLFGEFGLLDSLGQLPCVLPLTDVAAIAGELTEELAAMLPVAQAILRLPAAQCADPAQDAAIMHLRSQGFHLLADGLPPAGAELPIAVQALAIDCSDSANVAAAATWLGKLAGPHLALRVEDVSHYDGCRSTGFRWIAGNYPLHQPPPKPGIGNPGRSVMLKLLSQITSDADSRDIEKTLKQDPNLSYQLLKLVNSVAFALSTKISSFTQAIAVLGRRQLQRWLQLLLYARPQGQSDEASPLMPRAAMRAGLMEGLVRATGGSKEMQDRAFMVGMFSLLEALVGQPSAEVIKPLNLADEVTAALIAHQGLLGKLLLAVEAAEGGPDAATRGALAAAGISHAVWAAEQVLACRWAIQVSSEA